ncbi:conserved hypothetical protein [Roseibium sp. TrichSKD4]|uniref:DUF6101 family protein n=1 Tax=Roseibium sp. TrichSKD4 TaxID=744980 RepID=UPI0001E5627C|nr:DUF6101 family protein [Roseibium sp. TrichSKD4]EFO34494.1 conserved hypothetical protein [Roseibium sp. TrichSKD4]
MRRQTAHSEATGLEPGYKVLLEPGSIPLNFNQKNSGSSEDTQVYLDQDAAIFERTQNDLPLTVVVPMHLFEGVMVQVLPGEAPGEVIASLILKNKDPELSITLAETSQPEAFSRLWPEWSRALKLPMLVCDVAGDIKPIEAYSAKQDAPPAPRRRLAMLTGRRPRFLVKRAFTTQSSGSMYVHRDEREIIARS